MNLDMNSYKFVKNCRADVFWARIESELTAEGCQLRVTRRYHSDAVVVYCSQLYTTLYETGTA